MPLWAGRISSNVWATLAVAPEQSRRVPLRRGPLPSLCNTGRNLRSSYSTGTPRRIRYVLHERLPHRVPAPDALAIPTGQLKVIDRVRHHVSSLTDVGLRRRRSH